MPEVARSDLPSPPSPWRPLGNRTFRNLLAAYLISDIGAFMQSVGAAWLMTSLTDNLLYIALIQTASALPFFVLALPAGSIGDIFDRRKLILGTEIWMFGFVAMLTVTTVAGAMTPWLLLLLTLGLSVRLFGIWQSACTKYIADQEEFRQNGASGHDRKIADRPSG